MPVPPDHTPRAVYDEAWKELLDLYLPQILACFFPSVAAAIDWSRGYTFLDQELREVLPDGEVRVFRIDRLARVFRKDGGEQWILLHLEIQSFRESRFGERIYHYNHGIHRAFGRQPVSLVILADLDGSWRPDSYVHEELGCETRFRFLTCKLLDELDRLESDHSLPAIAAKAQIAALRTTGDPEKRYEVRWRMTRALYRHGFTATEVRAAYRVLSWMMRLPREMQLTFRREVIELEEKENMPYITDIVELTLEQGIEQGIERGQRVEAARLIQSLLERRCGMVPDSLRAEVEGLPLPGLEALALDLLDFRSVDDLRLWLERPS